MNLHRATMRPRDMNSNRDWWIEATHNRDLMYLRRLLINWKDTIRNEDIRKNVSKEETVLNIKRNWDGPIIPVQRTAIDWSNIQYFQKLVKNLKADVHVESEWTTSRRATDAVDKIYSSLHKSDANERN